MERKPGALTLSEDDRRMAAHARGVAYAAKAAGLAAPDDPAAVANEVGWQLSHASQTVRDVLRRLPPPPRSTGLLGVLISELHAGVTTGVPSP